ncbi:DEAD/DEAH box helicase [Rarobacter faecitabidus]
MSALRVRTGEAGQVRHVEFVPGRAGEFADWPTWADEDIVAGLDRRGVGRPWRHQVSGAEAIKAGRVTALATGTGSGKSLAYWLPVLSTIRASKRDRSLNRISELGGASAIYLSPTKALAADQLTSLRELLRASEVDDVTADACDGDTPFEARDWIRAHSDIVLTNPDFLHFTLLSNHERWTRLLRSLRYVIVDEAHAYRGLFGAHLALVLRRLQRVAAHYAQPTDPPLTFVIASATSADPALTASALTGVVRDRIVVVDADSAPTGDRVFALWQPPIVVDPEAIAAGEALADSDADLDGDAPGGSLPQGGDNVRRSAIAEAGMLTGELVRLGARLLTFTRSRRGAETVAAVARDTAQLAGQSGRRISAYRGGYLPEERRALEAAISSGEIRALATTNALELGIDISGLDATIIAGWPGSRASIWQQAGRAGRAGRAGLVILVARQDPLDNYLLDRPESLFGEPVEASVLDPSNQYVLGPHLCAAASELPLTAEDLTRFGTSAQRVVDELTAGGFLRKRGSRWFWQPAEPATALTDLRGAGDGTVTIIEEDSGTVIGTIDAAGADSAVHAGAIYVHQGQTFQVLWYEPSDHVAAVRRAGVDYHTWARSVTRMEILQTTRTSASASGDLTWNLGDVLVTSQVIEFERKRNLDNIPLGRWPLELPERSLETAAVWWTMSATMIDSLGLARADIPGALHAAEHAAIGVLPLLATCDRTDIGGLSTAWHEQTDTATIFLHDGAAGGAGFAERAFHLARTWLEATAEVIERCTCKAGCPACVQSPKCGNGNSPLHKIGALKLLRAVCEALPASDAEASAGTATTSNGSEA